MEPTLIRDRSQGPETKNAESQEPIGRWVPLLEFAHSKSVSLSTLRRYIKANKIQFKLERGRYFIFDADPAPVKKIGFSSVASNSNHTSTDGMSHGTAASVATFEEFKRLQTELQQAQKEIAELKMLVAFYEDKYTNGPSA